MLKSIVVLKHNLALNCTEQDEEHVDNAINILQNKIAEIVKVNKTNDREKIVIMSALMLLVELTQKEQDCSNSNKDELMKYSDKIASLDAKLNTIL